MTAAESIAKHAAHAARPKGVWFDLDGTRLDFVPSLTLPCTSLEGPSEGGWRFRRVAP